MSPIPVPNDNPVNGTSGCANVISSTCISWQGGDIECITICPGDTLTEVIEALGELACSTLDIAEYNTSGLAGAITNFETLIQTIIDTLVQQGIDISNFECDCPEYVLPTIILPDCVAALCGTCASSYPLDQIVVVIAEVFCQQFQDVNTELEEVADDLEVVKKSILLLQSATDKEIEDQIDARFAELTTCCDVTVGVHELTGPTAGAVVQSAAAIEYFANKMYEHVSVVGSVSSLQDAIALQSLTLKDQPQLNNPGTILQGLTGWQLTPNTVSHAISNLWLTLQDLRSAYVTEHSIVTLPCVLLEPKEIIILSTTTSTANIQWEAHGLDTIQEEVEFLVNIYEYAQDAGVAVGPALVSSSKERNAVNVLHNLTVTTSALDSSKDYVVEVISVYPCGNSEGSQIIGKVRTCTVNMFANAESRAKSTIPLTCDGVGYNKLTREMRVFFYDEASNVTNNNTGSTITIRLRYRVIDPIIANDVYEEFDFTIANNNSSSAWVEYTSYDQIYTGSICEDINRAEAVAYVEILDPSECFINAGTVTFI